MPKKGKGAAKAEPKKPISFDINHFRVERTAPGVLKLVPTIPPGFQEVSFKLKITKDLITGKPKYDIVYYDCKMIDVKPDGDHKDLRVFSVTIPETGRTLLIDPKKTQGNPPFYALDPVEDKESMIQHPLIIHHDKASGRNFLLDITKFDGGKMEFTDEQQGQTYTADLTKRVDPLRVKQNGVKSSETEQEEGTHHEDDVKFLGLIRNGLNYVVQSNKTGKIYIRDHNGKEQDAEEYDTIYDEETNTTKLIEYVESEDEEGSESKKSVSKSKILLTIEGEVDLDFAESEASDSDGGVKLSDVKVEEKKYKKKQDTSHIRINKEGELDSGEYFVFKDPKTKKMELFDSKGQVVNVPKFKLGKDDTGKTILVTMKGEPLSDVVEGLEGMVIANEQDLVTTENRNKQVKSNKISEKDSSKLGSPPRSVRGSSTPSILPSPEVSTGLKTKRPEKQNLINNQDGDEDSLESKTENMKSSHGSHTTLTPGLSKLLSKQDEGEHQGRSEEENYFLSMEYVEARNILEQIRGKYNSTEVARLEMLRLLMEEIEVNRELIKCALAQKKKVETKYVLDRMEAKKKRQVQYLEDLAQTFSDKGYVREKVMLKLKRENELLMESLDARMKSENEALISVVSQSISGESQKVVKYTNVPCYGNFKSLLLKELARLLEGNNQAVMEEIHNLLQEEKQEYVDLVDKLLK